MDVQIFGMKVLTEEEAWSFFREVAGTCVDDLKLNSIAKIVVKKCRGLPIALRAVGMALKHQDNKSIWKNALRELKQCDPDIPEVIREVYNPLRLSYDYLESEQAKSLFLFCCLFPEDADIPLEYLTYFCMGFGIFQGITNMEDARNKMCTFTELLKSRSLLLDGYYKNHVRMHDVVRDVCIYIAKKKGCIGGNNCTWISSSQLVGERNELLSGSRFPNLHLLFLNRRYDSVGFKFDDSFLEGFRELYVLGIENYSLTTMPHTTQLLRKLNTLILESCAELKTISVVGELVNLEIFICRNSGSIEELPSEMKALNRLKLLELTNCHGLQSIGRGIISSLVGLEELKMLYRARHHRLCNLGQLSVAGKDCLPQLQILHIQRCEMMEQVFLWKEKDENNIESPSPHHLFPNLKELWLVSLPNLTTFYQGIEVIQFPLLREMMITKCPKMKSIFGSNENLGGSSSVDTDDFSSHLVCQPQKVSFGNLKELEMHRNPFCSHKIHLSLFNGLEVLSISQCQGSLSLFSSSIARNLVNLRDLNIRSCDEMVKVIEEEEVVSACSGERTTTLVVFPKLEELLLVDLPRLVSFCEWKCDVELPSLREVVIVRCSYMKYFTLGPLTTPNLKRVEINFEDISAEKDLNGVVQLQQHTLLEQMKVVKNN